MLATFPPDLVCVGAEHRTPNYMQQQTKVHTRPSCSHIVTHVNPPLCL